MIWKLSSRSSQRDLALIAVLERVIHMHALQGQCGFDGVHCLNLIYRWH